MKRAATNTVFTNTVFTNAVSRKHVRVAEHVLVF